jgi:hypothetical protein
VLFRSYYYEYYLEDYEIIKDKKTNKQYETFFDIKEKRTKKYLSNNDLENEYHEDKTYFDYLSPSPK